MAMPELGNGAAFMLGDWRVEPARNRLVRRDSTVGLEPKTMDVLVFLAARAGDVVPADDIIDAVWDGRPMSDNPVYKCVAGLRKALGDSADYIETIPRRGYRVAADVQPVAAAAAPARRRLPLAAIAAAAVVALGLGWLALSGRDTPPASGTVQRSVAVLPFDHYGDDASLLAVGLSEDLLNRLARLPSLRVVARWSAHAADMNDDPTAAAARLGVSYLLTGSVRPETEGLHIAARLLEADGTVAWSGSYLSSTVELPQVENDIARSVATHLGLSDHAGAPERGTTRHEAWVAWVLGNEHLYRRSGRWRDAAISAFGEALRIDPDYAAAHAGFAMATLLSNFSTDEDMRVAEQHIDRALELAPNLAEAHAAAGLYEMNFGMQPDHDAAVGYLRRALELNPSLIAPRSWLSTSLKLLGHKQEAHAMMAEAARIDPLNPLINMNLGASYASQGLPDAARAQMEKALTLPDPPQYAWWWLSDLEKRAGRYVAAHEWLRQGYAAGAFRPKLNDWGAGLVAIVHAELGDFEKAERWLEKSASAQSLLWRVFTANQVLMPQQRYDDFAGRIEPFIQQLDAARPNNVMPNAMIGSFEARRGNTDAAIAWLGPIFSNGMPNYNGPGGGSDLFPIAQQLIVVYRQAGREQDAARLLDQLAVQQAEAHAGTARPLPNLLASEAVTLALTGDMDMAVAKLRQAVDGGWRRYYMVQGDPAFAVLAAEPRAAAILAEVRADLALQREQLDATLRARPFEPGSDDS